MDGIDAKEMKEWKVVDLKRFLRDRSLPVSGKKEDLVKRATGCLDFATKIGDLKENNTLSKQYDLLELPCGRKLPDPTTIKKWHDLGQIDCPQITDKDLYNYIVFSRHRFVTL